MPGEPRDIAARFESLGGGGLNSGQWAFGCEFGYWQRSLGLEPLGLLRWASISPTDLLKGLQAKFAGVEDENAILMREHTDQDWGWTQTTYGMAVDHSNMLRSEVPADVARMKIARSMGFLRDKLLADLADGEKLFVYRTYDHTIDENMQAALADAVGSYGKGIFCYVQKASADHPPFTAVRKSPNLIIGYIDDFAPREGQLIYNASGWEAVCRAALGVWNRPVDCPGQPLAIPPPEELLLQFVSLGDNCEFGLMQRQGGVEPLDLLRFSWTEFDHLIRGIRSGFAGIGEPESVQATWDGREFVISETLYKLRYHTFILDETYDRVELERTQSRHLKFLARKFLEDLKSGHRIFVRKRQGPADEGEALRLTSALRQHGQAWLLWVVEASADHPAGTVEVRQPGLLKGYIDRFSPYADASHSSFFVWLELCQRAYVLTRAGSELLVAPQPVKNVIDDSDSFGGWHGSPFALSYRAWDRQPPKDGAAVMQHVLAWDATPGTHQVYFWSRRSGQAAMPRFTASAWVWIPRAFEGSQVAIGVADCGVRSQVSADLDKRDCWQRVSTSGHLPSDQADAIVCCLYALGPALSIFYSSCWKLEPDVPQPSG